MMQQQNLTPTASELTPFTVVGAMLATAHLHRKHAKRFVQSTGIHPTAHRVLMYLSRLASPCKQRELSEHFELTPAAVVQIIDKLEADGYVTRVLSEHDNRCKEIVLTRHGKETASVSEQAFFEIDTRLLGNLSADEIETFYRVLLQMQKNMSADASAAEGEPV